MKSKNSKHIQNICVSALMAALIAVATAFIKFNTGINEGYLHFGDAMVYLSACILPPPYAMLSSAIGGALADIIAGAPIWAPATAVIKALNTLPISLMFYFGFIKRKDRIITPLSVVMSVVSGGVITIFGYLLAEGLMYSFPSAWASAPFSVIQATGSSVIFVVIGLALDAVKFKRRVFGMSNNSLKKADVIYTFEGTPYLNITNRCPCACTFCIRMNDDGLGSADNLWHKKEPSLNDIKEAISLYDFTGCSEIVFCGYGEPTEAYDNLIDTCEYLRDNYPNLKIRLNTNGLSDLINGRETAKQICEHVDCVSVSLNAPNSERYDELCRPKFKGAYNAIKKFISDCTKYCDDVRCSVVDVISEEEEQQCADIAQSLGAKMRVREKE